MFDNTKRIELHFHSKAGGNATMYPREIIKFFSEAQMPAFAVTDESNIGAFPELETEWETGKYSARPIYGMEVLLKDKEDETDCVSLLIRNEDGRKRLYKLISENESNEPYPLFRFERFVEEREGFLLGSGPANGRLYKSVKQGHGKDEIRKEISVFDYVEVLPGKKYESVNRTIIEICDELKIPVVAICDARYADNLGKKALKVMKHWNKKDEEAPDNLFLNTEEMLEAFSYLSEEKAYEIVVTNTHLIANMCETVSVCPKKECFPTVPNAKNRLKEKCFALLAEKYTDNYMAARDRVDWELSAIEKTGREFCFFQIKELLDMSNLTADDISLRGTASGSIIAYLLGISNIDPLKFGLEPEIIYGIDGERAIDIEINIPTSMHSEVVRNVGKLEGIGKYVLAGAVNTVSDTLARAMIERYMEENETYFDKDEFSGLVQMICGNYLGRGKHPGGVVVFPSECNYSEITPIAKLADGSEITYFDYYSVDRSFIKYGLLKHDSREMLTQLEKMTGVELSTVPVDSDEVIDLFSVDADGNVSGCEDLPEFKSNYVKKIIAALKPRNFNDLVKISAISHGTCTWADNGEKLVAENLVGIDNIIATRDDVFEYNLSLGLDRVTAFEIAEAVRKGAVSRGKKVKWQNWKKQLVEAGAPEWYIWSCEQIGYLFPRAHVISYIFMSMKLGWFKVHYPDEFGRVIRSFVD